MTAPLSLTRLPYKGETGKANQPVATKIRHYIQEIAMWRERKEKKQRARGQKEQRATESTLREAKLWHDADNPKTEVVEPVVGIVPAAISRTTKLWIDVPGTAASHTAGILILFQPRTAIGGGTFVMVMPMV